MGVLIDPAVSLALSLSLALLFAASALHKARDLRKLAGIIEAYQILPRGAALIAAPAVAAAEAAIAFGLLLAPLRHGAALAAAALLAGYGAAIAISLSRGRRDIDCGCSFGGGGAKISEGLVIRNAVLASGALVAAAPAGGRALGAFDVTSAALFALAAATLYAALEIAFANTARASAGGRR